MINKRFNCANIKTLVDEGSLKKGLQLYHNNKVRHVAMDEYEYISAMVLDDSEHLVEVKIIADKLVEYNCDCAEFDICDHVLALLAYLANVGVNISTYKINNDNYILKAKELIDELGEKECKELLKEMVRYKRNLAYFKNKYKDSFLSENIDSYIYKVNELNINLVTDNVINKGYEDAYIGHLKKYIDYANILVGKKHLADGVRLFDKVLEVTKNLDLSTLNDYQNNLINTYKMAFYKASFFEFYNKQELIFQNVKNNLDLFFKYLEKLENLDSFKVKYIQSVILLVVDDLLINVEDFKTSDQYYQLLYYNLKISYKENKAKIKEIAYNNLDHYLIRLLLVEFLIDEGLFDMATKLLEDGIIKDYHKEYLKPLIKLYERFNLKKHHEFLNEVFFKHEKYDYTYYLELKKSSFFKVDDLLSEIIRLENDYNYPDVYYMILVNERRYDDLILALRNVSSIEKLMVFNKYLIISHNKELLSIYMSLIERHFIYHGKDEALENYLSYFKMLPNAVEEYNYLINKFAD